MDFNTSGLVPLDLSLHERYFVCYLLKQMQKFAGEFGEKLKFAAAKKKKKKKKTQTTEICPTVTV